MVDGKVVTLKWLLSAIAWLVVVKSTIIGALAAVIFQRREIAEVQV